MPTRPTIKALAVAAPTLVAAVFYAKTLAPTVHWSDSAELQRVAHTLELTHPPGYPLYTILGRLWTALVPLGDVAYRMNLFSAVAGIVAVAIVALIAWRLTRHWMPTVFAGLVLATAPSYWSQMIVAEVYALHGLLLASLLLAALRERPRLPLVGLILGLSLSHHRMTVLILPGLLIALVMLVPRSDVTPRRALTSVVAFVVGSGVSALTLFQADWESFSALWSFVGHRGGTWLSADGIQHQLFTVVGPLATQQLGWYGLALAVLGAIWGYRCGDRVTRAASASLSASVVVALLFFLVYRVPDAFAFLPHLQVLVALLMGLGVAGLLSLLSGKLDSRTAGWMTAALAGALMVLILSQSRSAWAVNDRSSEDWLYPRVRSQEVLEEVPRGGVLVADWLLGQTMRYLQAVEHERTDVTVLIPPQRDAQSAVALLAEGQPVYLWGTSWRQYFPDSDGNQLIPADVGPHREGLFRLTGPDPLGARTWNSLRIADRGDGDPGLRSVSLRPWPVEAGQVAELVACWSETPAVESMSSLRIVIDPDLPWLNQELILPAELPDGECSRHLFVVPSPPSSSKLDAELLLDRADGTKVNLLAAQQWAVVPNPAASSHDEGWSTDSENEWNDIAGARMVGLGHSGLARPGIGVVFDVDWRMTANADPSHELVWRLRDETGGVVSEISEPIAPGFIGAPTAPGTYVTSRVQVPVPRRITPGRYTLEIQDPGSGRLVVEPEDGRGIRTMTIDVRDWDRIREAPTVDHDVGATLANGAIELYGYDVLSSETHQGPELSLVWHSVDRVDDDLKVFVHVYDADGALVAQSDAVPGNWLRWTDGWTPGEYVVDAHGLVVPADSAAGQHTIHVGMYDPNSGTRLAVNPDLRSSNGVAVSAAGDAIILGPVDLSQAPRAPSGAADGNE